MTPPFRGGGLGYESPTEHSVTSALAANHLMHRLNELEQNPPRRHDTSPSSMNMNDLVSKSEKAGGQRPVGIRERISCFQWTWFTSTMATGGIANVIASGMWILCQSLFVESFLAELKSCLVPFRAEWLDAIGLVFFFFNICLFVTNVTLLVMRFNLRPGSFRQSFTDQFESLFIPAAVSNPQPTCGQAVPHSR